MSDRTQIITQQPNSVYLTETCIDVHDNDSGEDVNDKTVLNAIELIKWFIIIILMIMFLIIINELLALVSRTILYQGIFYFYNLALFFKKYYI